MMAEKIGVQAVFETADFQKGLEVYKKGLADANRATKSMADGVKSMGAAGAGGAGGAGGITGLLGGIAKSAISAGGAVVAAGAVIVGALAAVVVGFVAATAAAVAFLGPSIQLASRWEELDLVAQLMGQKVGMTSEQVADLNQRMQDAGIRADVASKAISQFVRMEMNPEMALELGKVAQDLAVISQDGADSSETLDQLMLGIQRLSPIILRYAGANVDLEASYQDYAATMGIVGRELTQVEKQQAAYNAVLASGAKVAGAYTIAMDSAGKQMRSLSGREIPTLKNAIGAPFQDAFLNVARGLREMVKGFTAAISEGGALYPIMIKIGAIASIITDALMGLATTGANAVTSFFTWLSDKFVGMSDGAFEWGFNLVTEFATGIINAAASVLVSAINYIGSILAGWLSPGSPPKVAPNIVKWGTAAMTQYLKGFTAADFSVLKALQSPLKSAFDLMMQGGMSQKDAVKKYLNLSKDIAKALASGTADESLFKRIAKQAGEFGKEIADLARKEFALAAATDEVKEAQEAVNAAMEKQKGAEVAVRSLTDEYNRMLRAGASDEVLKAQLAQINAAEEQAILAGDEVTAAEDTLTEKEDALSILKEQVDLQKQLVDQLLEMAKMAILPAVPIAAGAGGAGGAGGGPAMPPLDLPIDFDAINSKIREAVEGAKREIERRWDSIVGVVRRKMRQIKYDIKSAWEDVMSAWDGFMVLAKQAWEEKLKPTFDKISELISVTIPTKWKAFTTILANGWQTFTTAIRTFWEETARPVFDAIIVFATVTIPGAWAALIAAGVAVWEWYKMYLLPIFIELWEVFGTIRDIILIGLAVAWGALVAGAAIVWAYISEKIIPIFQGLWNQLVTIKDLIIVDLNSAWEKLIEVTTRVWEWFSANILPVFTSLYNEILKVWTIIVTWFNPIWAQLQAAVQTAIDYIRDSVITVLTLMWEKLVDLFDFTKLWKNSIGLLNAGLIIVRKSLENFHTWLEKVRDMIRGMPKYQPVTKESVPPMAAGLDMVNERLKEFHRQLGTIKQDIISLNSLSASMVISPAMAAQSVIQQTGNRTMNIDQTNNIQSPMDIATFQAMFNQVVRMQFGGA